MYKEASRINLTFSSSKGFLTVSQLWGLSLSNIAILIKGVKEILKKDSDDELSFLDETTVVDKTNQLRFDILKDIYLTKVEENRQANEAKSIKEDNQEILALIKEKEKEALKGLSVEELKAKLK